MVARRRGLTLRVALTRAAFGASIALAALSSCSYEVREPGIDCDEQGNCYWRDGTSIGFGGDHAAAGDTDGLVGDTSGSGGDNQVNTGDAAVICLTGWTPPPVCDRCAVGYSMYGTRCLPLCSGGMMNCINGICVLDENAGTEVCACDPGFDEASLCATCLPDYVQDTNGNCNEGCNIWAGSCGANADCDDSTGVAQCVCDLGYQDVDGDDVCEPTCATVGWTQCGVEALCYADPTTGDPVCSCNWEYWPVGTQCAPSCTTLDPGSFMCGPDGSCNDSAVVTGGQIVCDCDPGYQDFDGDLFCAPSCDPAGQFYTDCVADSAGTCSMNVDDAASCTCPGTMQDNDGDGVCAPSCTASVCTPFQFHACDDSGPQTCPCVVYVREGADSGNMGESWVKAAPSVRAALNVVQLLRDSTSIRDSLGLMVAHGCQLETIELWVAEGTYSPNATIIADSFFLGNKLHLYGGFPNDGFNQYGRSDRDPVAHPTVLTGVGSGATAFNVLTIVSSTDVRIDGFVITGGVSDGTLNAGGSGLHVVDATNIVVANSFFVGNQALQGGAVMLLNYSAVTFVDVLFVANRATATGSGNDFWGGAIYSESTTLQLEGVTFVDNRADTAGGALYQLNGSVDGFDVIFARNSAPLGAAVYANGGTNSFNRIRVIGNRSPRAAYVTDTAQATVTNSLFVGNGGPTSSGGAIEINDTDVTDGIELVMTNVTLAANSALGRGSAIRLMNVRLIATNSVVWGNAGSDVIDTTVSLEAVLRYSHAAADTCSPTNACTGSGNTPGDQVPFRAVPPGYTTGSWNSRTYGGQPVDSITTIETTLTTYPPDNALVGHTIKTTTTGPHYLVVGNRTDIGGSAPNTSIDLLGRLPNLPISGTFILYDYRLAVASQATDSADGDAALPLDLDGRPRFDVIGVANTGAGSPSFVDMGCCEVQVP